MKKVLLSVFIGAATVALLAGCSSSPVDSGSGGEKPLTPPEPIVTSEPNTPLAEPTNKRGFTIPITDGKILEYCPDVEAVHFKDSGIVLDTEEPKTVYLCHDALMEDSYPYAEVGPKEIMVSQATAGTGMFFEAYSQDNAHTNPQGSCIEPLTDPFIAWVKVGDKDIVPIYAPVDECGFPTEFSQKAYYNLITEPLLTVKVQ